MARYIGVMSGTSMDAVDTVLVELDHGSARLLATSSSDWPPTLRERLHSFAAGSPLDATGLAQLDTDTGSFFAEAIRGLMTRAGATAADITAIGCHGQTVAHSPDGQTPTTLQLGDANRITELTGITTVNDFRRRDMAAGGQGAPLAPGFHAETLRTPEESRVVLNLGGIANVTILPADTEEAPTGFDTGPANCLMDAWARQHLGRPFDRDGAWAASATVDEQLLQALLADPYFSLPPPKSTGTQYFSRAWLQGVLSRQPQSDPARVQASLLALTVRTVADAIERAATAAQRVLVCGGGARNPALMKQLTARLGLPVESTGDHGIDPKWIEAMAFAWLARRTLQGRAGNLPSVTGAAGPRILGAIHPA